LDATVKRIRSEKHSAEPLAVDLSKTKEIERLTGTIRRDFADLKVVAHLATPRPDPDAESTLESTPISQIDGYVDVTVRATILITKGIQDLLANNAPSHLFFMSSDWALRGGHGPAVFSAAKAAVAHFGRSIRREMARSGVRTTVLLPGDIASFDADWEEPIWDIDDDPEKVKEALGNSRILLQDITTAMGAALDLKTGRIEEIIFAPDDAEYDY
jgi:NAD(P)-dependent dehydrogenase (short-subunit alcohol dehydrogenase family)